VVGDEDRDAEGGEAFDLGLKVLDGERIDGGEGLIEKDEAGLGDEGACDFEFSAFASGTGGGVVAGLVGEAELFEERGASALALGAGEGAGFEDGEEILFDGESLEDAGLLREVSHSEASAEVHGEPGDIAAVEEDGAAVGVDHSHDDAEGGGFSGAVATEEPDDFGGLDVEGDAVDDGAVVVGFDEVEGLEEGHEWQCRGEGGGREKSTSPARGACRRVERGESGGGMNPPPWEERPVAPCRNDGRTIMSPLPQLKPASLRLN